MIPYGRQSIDENDIRLVVETLRSDWLTTGPTIEQFENEFSRTVGSSHALAVSNGTAALHAAMDALELQSQDEVIVPAITFVATANAVVFQKAKPVFADVNPETLLICPNSIRSKITDKTRAIVAVDYAGQPCDYAALREIADEHAIAIVADACHSLGAVQNSQPVGNLADLSCFSFHPVKPITTGEGGMVTTHSEKFAKRIQRFRSHGIDTDFRQRTQQATHRYDMIELGYNYRMTDFQAALGIGQLGKLGEFTARRNQIAEQYDQLLQKTAGITPLKRVPGSTHAFHLYPVRIDSPTTDRDEVFAGMRKRGIGVNVHYRPVYLNSFYQQNFDNPQGICPQAEAAYQQILSLPVFFSMTDSQILQVVDALRSCLEGSTAQAA
ncbi:UDP-4-amino-4,6-dideoxy-N-acetyl-beta-L-altrosamine transaminase [bacterium]|nr:UDP-4-amino-4,6-dideoxy-N-acetyl-beta-L-altrosamine transaminase [bacterium]